jgi:hypothetical protein
VTWLSTDKEITAPAQSSNNTYPTELKSSPLDESFRANQKSEHKVALLVYPGMTGGIG